MEDNEVANYRPVTNLTFVTKLIERAVSRRLINYLETNHLIDDNQCAYRRHYSVESALIDVMNSMLMALDSGEVALLLMLDLTSAFDTVNHRLLIDKLNRYGIHARALEWIKDYLSDRTQRVVIGKSESVQLPVESGVPQGSTLGPLLFITHLNGIREVVIKHDLRYKLYADDILLFATCKFHEVDALIANLSTVLKIFHNGC
jgi:hypothetical protein